MSSHASDRARVIPLRPGPAGPDEPAKPVGEPAPTPREPLWRGLNLARGAYLKDLGNTPGHLNHWSKRSFVELLSRHGDVVQARSPFPWTMLLVRL